MFDFKWPLPPLSVSVVIEGLLFTLADTFVVLKPKVRWNVVTDRNFSRATPHILEHGGDPVHEP